MKDVLINIIGRDRVSAAFNTAAASAERSASKMAGASARMTAVGAKMTRSLTVPIVAISAVSAKMASDFNSAMLRIQTQAGGSAKDVQVLSTQVLGLAKTAQQGPKQLAEALYHLKSVGMDNVSAMTALKQASDLAAVGHANLEETTNALAGAWRTGIKGAKDFGSTVATLNAIIGSGNMTVEQQNAALGTGILASAKTFGLSLKDVGAALALFTDEGVPADAAATRIRMTLSLMGAPAQQAAKTLKALGMSGAEVTARTSGMTDMLAKAHVTTTQLAADMRKPNGLLVAVQDLSKHLKSSGLDASGQAAALSRAFGGGRSSSAIMSMVNNVDVLGLKYKQINKLMGTFNASVDAQRKTPSAQFAILASNLQRVSILIGNQVLPYLVALAKKVAGVVTWFGNLSSGTRKFLVTGALIVAALGPVIAIMGRVWHAAMLMRGGFLAVGTGVTSMVRVVQGMRAAELSIAAMETRSYGAGLKIRGAMLAIGSAVRNPAQGFRALAGNSTVMGAAFLAVGVAAVAVIKHFVDAADAGRALNKTWASLDQQVSDWKQSLLSSNGALDQTTRLSVGLALQQNGLADRAAKAGISLNQLVQGVTGNTAAYNQLVQAWKAGGAPSDLTIVALASMHGGFVQAARGAGQLASVATATGHAMKGTATGTKDLKASLQNTFNEQVPAAASATHSLADSTQKLSLSLKDAALSGQALSDALANLDGGALSAAQANVSFRQAVLGLKTATDHQHKSMTGFTDSALQNKSALLGALQSVKDLANAQVSQGRSGTQVAKSLETNIRWLEGMAVKAGFSKEQVQALVAQMHLVPADINSQLHVDGTDTAVANLKSIKMWMDLLHDKTVAINIVRHGASINSSGQASGPGFAKGGQIPPNTSFTVGEGASHTWEGGVSDSSGRVTIFSNRQSKALGFRTPTGYAKGSKPDQSTLSSAVSTAISNIGSASSPKFNINDVGVGRVLSQITSAWAKLKEEIGKGLSKNAAAAYRKELRAYTKLAQQQLASLRVKIRGSDVNTIRQAMSGTADDLRTAFATLIQDARNAGYTPAQIKNLQNREAQLIAKQGALTKAQTQLTNMQDYRTNIRQTLSGSFDPTQYGSVEDLVNGLGGATGTNKAYAGELNKLRGEAKGNKGLLAFINQLAASGQTTTLQTLAGASTSQLGQVARAYGGYTGSLTAGSEAATTTQYGTTVARQQADVTALKNGFQHLADSLTKPVPVHVHVHLNGKEISETVVHSKVFEQVIEHAGNLSHYGRKG